MSEQKTYAGQCHCGAVRFSVTTDLGTLGDCNCSRCARLGWVMQSVPSDQFILHSGADKLKTYLFNTKSINHQFCTECGIESFASGTDSKGETTMMVNIACLEGVPDIDRTGIKHWDGRSW